MEPSPFLTKRKREYVNVFERIENFNRAFDLYEEMRNGFVADNSNNAYRLGLTQSFEIICELGWKILKDYLELNETKTESAKDTVRKAFNADIIENGQIWIDMVKDRNSTSHEYNMDKVNLILERVSTTYYDELLRFKEWLGGLNAG